MPGLATDADARARVQLTKDIIAYRLLARISALWLLARGYALTPLRPTCIMTRHTSARRAGACHDSGCGRQGRGDTLKILVTGGAGFIGSRVAAGYLQLGHTVMVVDDLSTGRRENVPTGAGFCQMRVQDAELASLFERERFDVVNHHAAHISVTESLTDPLADAENNIMGTVNLLACAVRFGVKQFILAASGGATYGECRPPGAGEDWPLEPQSPYGVSKMAAERYLYVYAAPHHLPFVSLRYANVYGPQTEPAGETGVVTVFSQRLVAGLPPLIYGDGEQTRDFVYVDDVVRANICALEYPASDCFNISTGRATSINALVGMMIRLSGVDVAPERLPARPGEIQHSCLNPTKAATKLGWVPQTDLEQGLRSVLELAQAWWRAREGR